MNKLFRCVGTFHMGCGHKFGIATKEKADGFYSCRCLFCCYTTGLFIPSHKTTAFLEADDETKEFISKLWTQ